MAKSHLQESLKVPQFWMPADNSKPLGIKLTKIQLFNCFLKCGFSSIECVNEKTEDNAEFRDLFQLLTSEVTAEEYLSFDDDVEMHEDAG